MIKLKSLIESKSGVWNWYKEQLPDWPDYVIKDLIYTPLKNHKDMADKKKHIDILKQRWEGIIWKLEEIPITIDVFEEFTKRQLINRAGGKLNPYGIPNDSERHTTQMNLIKSRGISKEPIIVIKSRRLGYELIEGWHRTIQNLQAFPEGYNGNAWVGYI